MIALDVQPIQPEQDELWRGDALCGVLGSETAALFFRKKLG